MIYALLNPSITPERQRDILNAISENNCDTLQSAVNDGILIHILTLKSLDVSAPPLFCLWCCRGVKVSNENGAGDTDSDTNWHFKHRSGKTCLGFPSLHFPEYKNPEGHGCYVALNRETLPGRLRHRTKCHCIADSQTDCITDRRTYCHLAVENVCLASDEAATT